MDVLKFMEDCFEKRESVEIFFSPVKFFFFLEAFRNHIKLACLSYIDGISQQRSWSSGSSHLFTPSSAMFPEPYM